MAIPRLLPQRALISMRGALCDLQERMLDEEPQKPRLFNIDDVQRAIEWVEYELRRRSLGVKTRQTPEIDD